MLLGLRLNGRAVIGTSEISASAWTTFLGRQPPKNHIKGRCVSISWLKQLLEETEISKNSSHDELIIYTRIYNILCISLTLFPDKSEKDVDSMWIPFVQDLRQCGECSWGIVALAFLYREICKVVNIDVDGMGGVILLQTWGFT
ncbi:protein MAIN-LIKE 2-like [Lathyrus oleraceus]|uniref:protein MAIN-LIKE 2-like n=1 Tax=Pisum sativum TaxID=3888 RepID=UPI0021D00861|nr:protein MAIN-LIKE 2-like [Pisum sativum]